MRKTRHDLINERPAGRRLVSAGKVLAEGQSFQPVCLTSGWEHRGREATGYVIPPRRSSSARGLQRKKAGNVG